MSKSQHELDSERIGRRLRAKNSAGGKAAGLKLAGLAARPSRKKSVAGRAARQAGSMSGRGASPALAYKKGRAGAGGDSYAARRASDSFTNMVGSTPQARARLFELDSARQPGVRPDLLQVHTILSRPTGGELTLEAWRELAESWLAEIGAKDANHVGHVHADTNNQHLHLIWSRVRPDGSLVSLSWDYVRHKEAANVVADRLLGAREVARPASPTPVPPSDRAVSAERRAARRQTPSPHIDRAIISEALAGSTSRSQFESRLAARGVELRDARRADGTTTGLLFRRQGADEFLAGSSIDRSFSLPKIEAQLAENRRLLLLKQEQQAVIQRQRAAIERQRQAQQVQGPRER